MTYIQAIKTTTKHISGPTARYQRFVNHVSADFDTALAAAKLGEKDEPKMCTNNVAPNEESDEGAVAPNEEFEDHEGSVASMENLTMIQQARARLRTSCSILSADLFQNISFAKFTDTDMTEQRNLLCGYLSIEEKRKWSNGGGSKNKKGTKKYFGELFDHFMYLIRWHFMC